MRIEYLGSQQRRLHYRRRCLRTRTGKDDFGQAIDPFHSEAEARFERGLFRFHTHFALLHRQADFPRKGINEFSVRTLAPGNYTIVVTIDGVSNNVEMIAVRGPASTAGTSRHWERGPRQVI